MTQIDLNADMGESFGPWVMGNDSALLDIVTSANIACGFHAGGVYLPAGQGTRSAAPGQWKPASQVVQLVLPAPLYVAAAQGACTVRSPAMLTSHV